MALYMLATDIAVCVIQGSSRVLDERIASMAPAELCISAVTRRELLLGLSRDGSPAPAGHPTAQLRARAGAPEDNTARAPSGAAQSPAALPPLDPAAIEDLRRSTHSVLAALSPREAKALRMRFGIEAGTEPTLESVSREFAMARERIQSAKPPEDDPQSPGQSTAIEHFLSGIACLAWDAAAASCFATIAIEAHQIGQALSTPEAMVAGHALAMDAVLVTTNEPRLSRLSHIRGLKTENWTHQRTSQ
jgi:predicted nucleic acid-binding protein